MTEPVGSNPGQQPPPPWSSPAWNRAATLRERLAGLRSAPRLGSLSEAETSRAAHRLAFWRNQESFEKPEIFSERLTADRATEEDLLILLGESPEEIGRQAGGAPDWVQELRDCLSAPVPANREEGEEEAVHWPEGLRGHPLQLFFGVVEPVCLELGRRFRERLAAVRDRWPEAPFGREIAGLLLKSLQLQLTEMVNRAVLLDLHLARIRQALGGASPEERFASFLRNLTSSEGLAEFYHRYPVLARQVILRAATWLEVSTELVTHLAADWADLCAAFSPEADPGCVAGLRVGEGDRHRGGRSVVTLLFESGLRLVYKPRAGSIDLHFQELLSWLDQRGEHPPFRPVRLLDRRDHTWVEFIEARPCGSEKEVQRFYRRQGALLALFFILEATDLHAENLIACGEYPVPIDLEALFHPRPPGPDTPDSEFRAAELVGRSVLRVGLLPARLLSEEDPEGVDLSGIGGAARQLTPRGVPAWVAVGTDEMRFVRRRVEMPDRLNRPTLQGAEVDLLDYVEVLLEGFSGMWRTLVRYRGELLAPDGPLATFSEDEVRVLLRRTATYGLLLQDSFHPDSLRDALDRDRFFDRLWRPAARERWFARVIPAEQEDLLAGDIPLFTSRPDSQDLWTSRGQRLPGFFVASALEVVRQRLRLLDDHELARQTWFVRAALATTARRDDRVPQPPPAGAAEAAAEAGAERLLRHAVALGDRLEELALQGERDAVWIGLNPTGTQHWLLSPLSVDLYGGLPGVVLFLAYLEKVTGEHRFRDLARRGLTTLERQLERGGDAITSIGAFTGWAGLIHTWMHLGVLWREPGYLERAEGFVGRLRPLIEKDEDLDVIGGAAGCAKVLLSFQRLTGSPQAVAAARLCGERLLATAVASPPGLSWITRSSRIPLAGFSHGCTGFAWALAELAAELGEPRFSEAARGALAFERTFFDPEAGNWQDRRVFTTSQKNPRSTSFMAAWCHGAPGIALGRLLTAEPVRDQGAAEDIRIALATTLTAGFGNNHSLCHGDLGNAEILLMAAQRLADDVWHERARRTAARVAASLERHGPRCGLPLGVESPGLMTGLAGIGYGLLRLAAPEAVPSVLCLEPPDIPVPPLSPEVS